MLIFGRLRGRIACQCTPREFGDVSEVFGCGGLWRETVKRDDTTIRWLSCAYTMCIYDMYVPNNIGL